MFLHKIFVWILLIAILYYRKFRLVIFLVVVIDTRGSMKLIKAKDFLVLWSWERIKAGSNWSVYEILEDCSSMRLGVDVRKLHVRSWVQNFNFYEMKFMESSDQGTERYCLGSDPVHHDSLSCCLVILIYFWLRSYEVTNLSKKVSDSILI